MVAIVLKVATSVHFAIAYSDVSRYLIVYFE